MYSKTVFKDPEPKPQEGAIAPLFDRLIDEHKNSDINPMGKRIYNMEENAASIAREISNLLNTRLSAKEKDYEEWSKDALNFGLPQMYGLRDFAGLSPASTKDQFFICQMCEAAIGRYEPRLSTVKVTVISYNEKDQSLSINIHGIMTVGYYTEEVNFPMRLEC